MNVIRPNDIIADADHAIVIASFVYNEQETITDWGCLLMHDSKPYYQVSVICADDNRDIERHQRYIVSESNRFDNLIDAFSEYQHLIIAKLSKR